MSETRILKPMDKFSEIFGNFRPNKSLGKQNSRTSKS